MRFQTVTRDTPSSPARVNIVPFSRVRNEQTRYIVGSGLGLPVVKGIVDAYNGRIEVESQVDQGSTFSAFIPIA